MNIMIDNEEMLQGKDLVEFLQTLSPDTQEKFKTIIWWEGLIKGKKTTENKAVTV